MVKILDPQKSVLNLINRCSNFIPSPEVEILLSYTLDCARGDLYINNYPMDERIEKLCYSFIERRLSGEPLQYIIGTSEFMGLEFLVNKDVFIPRPETELLVNEVFQFTIHHSPFTIHHLKILELCTGCGNIAISLARLMPCSKIVAIDISRPALEVAQKNSIIHKTDKNITFYRGDFFHTLPFDKKDKFDIMVCNPPYIKSAELKFLQIEVRGEPKVALDGGVDGLEFYRRIEKEAELYLKPGGSLFLEMGFGQAQDIIHIFSSRDRFVIRKVEKDFAGIDRLIALSLRREQ